MKTIQTKECEAGFAEGTSTYMVYDVGNHNRLYSHPGSSSDSNTSMLYPGGSKGYYPTDSSVEPIIDIVFPTPRKITHIKMSGGLTNSYVKKIKAICVTQDGSTSSGDWIETKLPNY